MKKTALSTAILTFSALSAKVSAASCDRYERIGRANRYHYYHYLVKADGVGDIPGVCNELRDKISVSCKALVILYPLYHCGGYDRNLAWSFSIGLECDGGLVELAWLQATYNFWGQIWCPKTKAMIE